MNPEIQDFLDKMQCIENVERRLDYIFKTIDEWLWVKDHKVFFEDIFEYLIQFHVSIDITTMIAFLSITRPLMNKSEKREWLCLLLEEQWKKTEGPVRTRRLLTGLM